MTTPDGRLTVAFNGEIYNFASLREELAAAGAHFGTAGDTEVLLHLFRRDGAAMLERLEGMFAFALYDAQAGALLLARDRLGQKPLWYAPLPDRIVFASEAKALLLHPNVSREMDVNSIDLYVSMGYIPAPRSAWRAVRKLPPAHLLVIQGHTDAPRAYWTPEARALPASGDALAEHVRDTVGRARQARMVAHVPRGAQRTGGLA